MLADSKALSRMHVSAMKDRLETNLNAAPDRSLMEGVGLARVVCKALYEAPEANCAQGYTNAQNQPLYSQ